MHAMPNVKDMSPLNIPATFNRHAANTVKAKVERLILVYVDILRTLLGKVRANLPFAPFWCVAMFRWHERIMRYFVTHYKLAEK